MVVSVRKKNARYGVPDGSHAMSTYKHSLFQAILSRISLGAVPVDGAFWSDPKHIAAAKPSKRAEAPDAAWSPFALSLSRPRRVR
jgi:hypothetical protein